MSDKLQNRFWFFIYPIIVSSIGCLVCSSVFSVDVGTGTILITHP